MHVNSEHRLPKTHIIVLVTLTVQGSSCVCVEAILWKWVGQLRSTNVGGWSSLKGSPWPGGLPHVCYCISLLQILHQVLVLGGTGCSSAGMRVQQSFGTGLLLLCHWTATFLSVRCAESSDKSDLLPLLCLFFCFFLSIFIVIYQASCDMFWLRQLHWHHRKPLQ